MKEGLTRIDILRNYVDKMLLDVSNDELRRNGYVHLYSVGMFAALIALKRGFDPELAEMAGILHDYYKYKENDRTDHAHRGAILVRQLLNELNITTTEETEMIYSAIFNHRNKEDVGSDFDEIIKDADVLQHWLQNPRELFFKEGVRIERISCEFGLNNDCKKEECTNE